MIDPARYNPGSISNILWEMGVTHDRDEWSSTDSCHALYFAGKMIGRYSAFEVCSLLHEHGLDADAATPTTRITAAGDAT